MTATEDVVRETIELLRRAGQQVIAPGASGLLLIQASRGHYTVAQGALNIVSFEPFTNTLVYRCPGLKDKTLRIETKPDRLREILQNIDTVAYFVVPAYLFRDDRAA